MRTRAAGNNPVAVIWEEEIIMYLQHLYPVPEKIATGDGCFAFGAELAMETDACLEMAEQERIRTLFYQFTCTASTLKLSTKDSAKEEIHAVLHTGRGDSLEQAGNLDSSGGYRIQVLPDMITIAAKDSKTFVDAFTTLVQLIEPEDLSEGGERFLVRSVEIQDKAAMSFRCIHLCVFPETRPLDLQKAIRLAGFLKFTHVILEFWGMYPYKSLPELAWKDRAYSLDTIRELVTEIRSFGMEPVPMLNHLGHAAQCRAGRGRHVVLDQAPRYAMLFEPDGWTWCTSNPDTYKLLGNLRSELMETFGQGSYFHLGFDEAYSFATCPKCAREQEEGRFLAEFINRLAADLRKEGRRSIIWHDEFLASKDWPEKIVANGDRLHKTADGIAHLDKDVIIADWQYYDGFPGGEPTAEYFMKKGFDVLLCPWNEAENVRNLCNTTKRLGAMGMIMTTWQALPAYLRIMPDVAVMMWDAVLREEPPRLPATETAALLRKLITGTKNFEDVGWIQPEVYPFETGV